MCTECDGTECENADCENYSGRIKNQCAGYEEYFCGFCKGFEAQQSGCQRMGNLKKTDKSGQLYALAKQIAKTVIEKQAAYGDSFGKSGDVMRILYPDGIRPEQMGDALAVVRILDKLFRIASKKDAFGESPYLDLAGYGLLGATKNG